MSEWPVQQARQLLASFNLGGLSWTTVNTKGAYQQLTASTPFDVQEMLVMVANGNPAAQQNLVDFAVGGSGSETPIINNYQIAEDTTNNQVMTGTTHFPLYIPAGSRLSARAQGSTANAQVHLNVALVGGHFPTQRALGLCTTMGANTANSQGTSVTSSYTQIIASTARTFKHLVAVFSPTSGTYAITRRIAIGSAGNEVDIWVDTGDTVRNILSSVVDFPCFIPAGSRLSAKCTTTTESVTLYGIS